MPTSPRPPNGMILTGTAGVPALAAAGLRRRGWYGLRAGFGAAAGTAPVWEAAGFAAGAAVFWRVSDTPGVAALGALGARGRDAF